MSRICATPVANSIGWRLVGIDVQTLLSDLAAAVKLWEWVADELDNAEPTALFLHRPLRPWTPDEIDSPNRYITEPARSRLMALMERASVRLLASGHVHQWRVINDGCLHVWAPPRWAVLPERIQPDIGVKLVGLVDHDLGADGLVSSDVVQPPRIAQVTVGDDFESPYTH